MASNRAAFLLWVFGVGCASTPKSNDVGTEGDRISAYAPLRIGAWWTYQMAFPGQSGEMTVKMVGQKDGYFVDDRGGHFRHTQEGLRDRQRYLIKSPLRAGNRWRTVVSASAVEHNQIESVGERCESVAGPFPDCLVVTSSLRRDAKVTLHIRWTWAKGVGLVKVQTTADIAGRGQIPQTKQSLVRYSVSGKGEESDDGPDTWQR